MTIRLAILCITTMRTYGRTYDPITTLNMHTLLR